jgi:hypothetical protein
VGAPRRSTPPRGAVDVNHRFQSWGFIFLFGFMLPMFAVQSLFFDPERQGGALVGLIALALAPLAWGLLWEARFRIRVSERGVTASAPGGRRREIAWPEVSTIAYSPLFRVLIVHSKSGAPPLRVSLLRGNVDAMARLILHHLPPGVFVGPARDLFRAS